MNRSQGNLQDAFLNSARRESIGVTIYLVSGVQLRGVIRAFDAFTVLLESQGRPPQMVYKHAIASVAPVRTVPMDASRDDPAQSESEPGAVMEPETAPTPPAPPLTDSAPAPQEPAEPVAPPEPARREVPVSP